MHTLLRLPLILLEMALRQGAGAVKEIVRLVAGSAGEQDRPPAPAERPGPDPAAVSREAQRVAAEEARARRPEARPRAAARRPPPPPPPTRPPRPPPPPPRPPRPPRTPRRGGGGSCSARNPSTSRARPRPSPPSARPM